MTHENDKLQKLQDIIMFMFTYEYMFKKYTYKRLKIILFSPS